MVNDDLDNEGAIDTGDDSQQAPAPQAGMIDMGDPPVATDVAQTPAIEGIKKAGSQMASDIGKGVENIKNDPIVKRITSYIMGADGDPAAALSSTQQAKQQNPQINDSDAALIGLHTTLQTKGPDAAAKELQGHRFNYNAKLAFGVAAMDGVQGKAPNLASAVDAANQAMPHMLDGSDVKFAPTQGGVTATVTMPGTSQVQQIPLTPDAFRQFIDIGKNHWDKVQSQGVPAILQALSKGQGQEQDDSGGQARMNPSMIRKDSGPGEEKDTPAMSAFGETADQRTPDGARPWIPPRTGNYGNELENRALSRFPSVGQDAERKDWMAAQEEKELERQSKLNVATQQGVNATAVADIRAKGLKDAWNTRGQHQEETQRIKNEGWRFSSLERAKTAQAKLDAIVAQERARNGRAAQNSEASILRAKLASGVALDDNDQAILKKFGVAADTAISAPQQQQASRQAPPQGGAPKKMYNGKLYTREEYERDVLGK